MEKYSYENAISNAASHPIISQYTDLCAIGQSHSDAALAERGGGMRIGRQSPRRSESDVSKNKKPTARVGFFLSVLVYISSLRNRCCSALQGQR